MARIQTMESVMRPGYIGERPETQGNREIASKKKHVIFQMG